MEKAGGKITQFNGDQTAETSSGIAEKVAKIIYTQPTIKQVNQVHTCIRTLAHIGLFFVLGVLSYSAILTTIGRATTSKRLLGIFMCV